MAATDGPLTGTCPHCQWSVIACSYPAVVEAYHDHLREHHPDHWLKA